jgi:hypothetical protein
MARLKRIALGTMTKKFDFLAWRPELEAGRALSIVLPAGGF